MLSEPIPSDKSGETHAEVKGVELPAVIAITLSLEVDVVLCATLAASLPPLVWAKARC